MPIYMNYEGIKGSVNTKGYDGWIELQSCQLGVHRYIGSPTGKNSNRKAGAPTVNEIVLTKSMDNSSTKLFEQSIKGEGKKVTIVFLTTDEKDPNKLTPYMTIELENVLISGYSVSGHGGSRDGDVKPIETLTLNFTKINYVTAATSSIDHPKSVKNKADWDLATQKIKGN